MARRKERHSRHLTAENNGNDFERPERRRSIHRSGRSDHQDTSEHVRSISRKRSRKTRQSPPPSGLGNHEDGHESYRRLSSHRALQPTFATSNGRSSPDGSEDADYPTIHNESRTRRSHNVSKGVSNNAQGKALGASLRVTPGQTLHIPENTHMVTLSIQLRLLFQFFCPSRTIVHRKDVQDLYMNINRHLKSTDEDPVLQLHEVRNLSVLNLTAMAGHTSNLQTSYSLQPST